MNSANTTRHKNEIPAITENEVRDAFDAFIAALCAGDHEALQDIYDDDYLLVRPDGTVLGKKDILNDLKGHSMVLSSFETTSNSLKTKGTIGILSAEAKSAFVRDGQKQSMTHARQVVIFVKTNIGIRITHFQSTGITG